MLLRQWSDECRFACKVFDSLHFAMQRCTRGRRSGAILCRDWGGPVIVSGTWLGGLALSTLSQRIVELRSIISWFAMEVLRMHRFCHPVLDRLLHCRITHLGQKEPSYHFPLFLCLKNSCFVLTISYLDREPILKPPDFLVERMHCLVLEEYFDLFLSGAFSSLLSYVWGGSALHANIRQTHEHWNDTLRRSTLLCCLDLRTHVMSSKEILKRLTSIRTNNINLKHRPCRGTLLSCLELRPDDRPSQQLLDVMEANEFDAPPCWKGFREISGKSFEVCHLVLCVFVCDAAACWNVVGEVKCFLLFVGFLHHIASKRWHDHLAYRGQEKRLTNQKEQHPFTGKSGGHSHFTFSYDFLHCNRLRSKIMFYGVDVQVVVVMTRWKWSCSLLFVKCRCFLKKMQQMNATERANIRHEEGKTFQFWLGLRDFTEVFITPCLYTERVGQSAWFSR